MDDLVVSIDELLRRYLKAAEGYSNAYNEVDTDYTKDTAPDGVKLAILMLASEYFLNREATTDNVSKANLFGVHSLLNNHRKNFSV